MPSFEDPKQDANELGQTARALAYATRHIDNPADTYEVLGSIHQALSGVQQSLHQLASWHEQHSALAKTDSGDRAAGHEHAMKASGWLRIAAAEAEQMIELVMRAQGENGRIAWQSEQTIAARPDQHTDLSQALASRESALDPDPAATMPGQSPERGLTR